MYRGQICNLATVCTQSRDVIQSQMEYRSVYKRDVWNIAHSLSIRSSHKIKLSSPAVSKMSKSTGLSEWGPTFPWSSFLELDGVYDAVVYSVPFILWECWFAVKPIRAMTSFSVALLHCSHDPVSDLAVERLAIWQLSSSAPWLLVPWTYRFWMFLGDALALTTERVPPCDSM